MPESARICEAICVICGKLKLVAANTPNRERAEGFSRRLAKKKKHRFSQIGMPESADLRGHQRTFRQNLIAK
jgi:hypothetical protein